MKKANFTYWMLPCDGDAALVFCKFQEDFLHIVGLPFIDAGTMFFFPVPGVFVGKDFCPEGVCAALHGTGVVALASWNGTVPENAVVGFRIAVHGL